MQMRVWLCCAVSELPAAPSQAAVWAGREHDPRLAGGHPRPDQELLQGEWSEESAEANRKGRSSQSIIRIIVFPAGKHVD